jgi:hypothetical protein
MAVEDPADAALDRFPGGLSAPQQWLDGILPKLPNIPVDWVKHETLSVLRDFCRESGVWREWVGPVVTEPGVSAYALPAPYDGVEPGLVYKAVRDLPAEGEEEPGYWHLVARAQPVHGPRLDRLVGDPAWYWRDAAGNVLIYPVPASTDPAVSCWFYCSLVPLDLCGPDWLRGEHFDTIVDGVLGRAYLMPGPNKDKEAAVFHRRAYLAARTRAKVRAAGGGVDGKPWPVFPYFARGRHPGGWGAGGWR